MNKRKALQLESLVEQWWHKNRQIGVYSTYKSLSKVSLIYSPNFSQFLIESFMFIIILKHLCFLAQ